MREFEKRLQFLVKRNDLRSLVYVIPSCCKGQSELEMTIIKSDKNLEQCQSDFAESYADVRNYECSFRESLSDANTDTEVGNNLKSYRKCQLDPEAQSDCETDNTSINETSDTQEVNADTEESPPSFKNSTSITLTDNQKDIESNIFEKFFKANDVSSIDNSWRTATIFSKEESLKNENEKFISDDLIYNAMTKLNFTSELFVTGGFSKSNVPKKRKRSLLAVSQTL